MALQWHDGAEQPRSQDGVGVTTVNSLLSGLRDEIFGGQPPEEYHIAAEPWGSFAFRPGDVTAIAAPPGMGKTAFITQATIDALRLNTNASCLTVNIEMTPKVILKRQVARLSGVPYQEIFHRQIALGQHHLLDNSFATLESIGDRMGFMDAPFSIERVIKAAYEMQPRIVVLDYLQRIECCDGVADNRVRLNNLMHEARQLASSGVSVVLISAVGRTQSKKGGGYSASELGLGSFRESSEVEYGADDAYVMVEEGMADEQTGIRTLVMRHVKSRNHRRQDIRLEFDGTIQRFRLARKQDVDNSGRNGWRQDFVASPVDGRRGDSGPAALPPPPRLLPDTFAADFLDGE
jgi:replicative DNA helicase